MHNTQTIRCYRCHLTMSVIYTVLKDADAPSRTRGRLLIGPSCRPLWRSRRRCVRRGHGSYPFSTDASAKVSPCPTCQSSPTVGSAIRPSASFGISQVLDKCQHTVCIARYVRPPPKVANSCPGNGESDHHLEMEPVMSSRGNGNSITL
jgi:hypothetical protein